MNDIEIAGVPERSGENVLHLTTLLAKKLGVNIGCEDVVSVERSGPPRIPEGTVQPRPRVMTVRLTRRALRDEVLRAARTRRGVDTAGIVDGDSSRFYVNERLSRVHRMLFYKSREMARRLGWRYIWTRGGRIYARRDSGAPAQRVRVEEDLGKVFGSSLVGIN